MTNALQADGLGYAIPCAVAPDDRQRTYLDQRLAALGAWLAPLSRSDMTAELGLMLDVMPAAATTDISREVRLRVYLADLADVPGHALRAAVAAYRRGETGSGPFAPSVGELRQAALRRAQGARDEAARIDRLLRATVLPELPAPKKASVKETVEALTRELSSTRPANEIARAMRPKVEAEKPLNPEEKRAQLQAEYAAKPVTLSPSALRAYRAERP